jgi:hypothetical protein
MAGRYKSTSVVTLNNGVTLPISVGADAFIVKYDTSGAAQWATTIPGTGSADNVASIATYSTDVYVSGSYNSTSVVTLNNGKTLSSTVGEWPFIVKYNTSGIAQWAISISSPGNGSADGIAIDSTGVYVVGRYTSTPVVTLDNGITLPSAAVQAAFIVKYNTSGLAQWAISIAPSISAGAFAIAIDSTGVYVAGAYNSASVVTLNNGKTLPTSVGGFDAFIVKYDTSGLAQWATTISGTGADSTNSITIDSTGVYVVGRYTSTPVVTLNKGKTLPASVGQDVFIVKYNTSGLAQWATAISGTGYDNVFGIANDSTGVYVTGNYTSTSKVLLTDGS